MVKLEVEKLHITESLTRLGGVEVLVRQLLLGDPGSHAASLLDCPSTGIEKGTGLRPGRYAGACMVRRNARTRFAGARHLVFHNFSGMMMLSGIIPHERKTLFLHTNSSDVFALLPERLQYLDAILVSGNGLKTELHDRFPDINVPITAVNYPIDDRYFAPCTRAHDEKPTIGYSGRLEVEQKQVMRLVSLCGELSALSLPFQLEIAGSGGAAAELRRSLPPEDCRFLGVLNAGELHDAHQRWDYMICTSDYETGPLVAMEAMASGVIPILPDIPCQATSLIADTDLPLYPRGDMKMAADIIKRLRESSGLERLRVELRHKVADRRLHRFVESINVALDEVVNRPAVGRTPDVPHGIAEFLPFKLRRADHTYLR